MMLSVLRSVWFGILVVSLSAIAPLVAYISSGQAELGEVYTEPGQVVHAAYIIESP